MSDPALPPLAAGEWEDQHYEAFGALLGVAGDEVPRAGSGKRFDPLNFDVVGVLVRSPALAKRFLGFNAHLLRGSPLPARERELCILRVAHRRRCAYEWAEHVVMARGEGVADAEIEAIAAGNDAFSGSDRLVLDATDQLLDGYSVEPATWDRLVDAFGTESAIDLLFVVGTYEMLAKAFNTWGLTPVSDAPRLP